MVAARRIAPIMGGEPLLRRGVRFLADPKPEESEKVEGLARVIATAEEVWADEHDARRFLTSSHPLLGDRRPIDVAQTELGARQVEELLWQIMHGLPI